jgi:RHS repeat-associated protein
VRTAQTVNNAGETLVDCAYTYNSQGNVATEKTSRITGGLTTTDTSSYSYDAYDHLGDSYHRRDDGTTVHTHYEITVAGDVGGVTETTTHPDGQVSTNLTSFQINELGHATQITKNGANATQEFDTSTGDVKRDHRGYEYEYTPSGLVRSAKTPHGLTQYTNWIDGTRATATATTPDGRRTTTRYHYSHAGEVINDTHTDGTADVTANYLITPTGRHHRQLTGDHDPNADEGYYLHDSLGSITAMTNAQGERPVEYEFSDYGNPTTHRTNAEPTGLAATNPFLYTGALTDRNTGNAHMDIRDYDSRQGRFLRKDPAPQFKKFAYTDSNPKNYIDPTGRTSEQPTLTATLAGTSGLTSMSESDSAHAFLAAFTTLGFVASVAALWLGTAGSKVSGIANGRRLSGDAAKKTLVKGKDGDDAIVSLTGIERESFINSIEQMFKRPGSDQDGVPYLFTYDRAGELTIGNLNTKETGLMKFEIVGGQRVETSKDTAINLNYMYHHFLAWIVGLEPQQARTQKAVAGYIVGLEADTKKVVYSQLGGLDYGGNWQAHGGVAGQAFREFHRKMGLEYEVIPYEPGQNAVEMRKAFKQMH